MEKLGEVNCYSPYKTTGDPVYTINLATGVTPMFESWGGCQYASSMYRLSTSKIEVSHAWYRPNRAVFDRLDKATKQHVLQGGLLSGPLALAVDLQLKDDVVGPKWDFEALQKWFLQVYGTRLEKP